MNDDVSGLRKRLSAKSSEELARIVNIDFADYRPEALDIAWEELRRRGCDAARLAPAGAGKAARAADGGLLPKKARAVMVALVTAAVTILFFPAISYNSVLVYGLPASAFMLLGYEVWHHLRRARPEAAAPFAVGFIPPVAFFLAGLLYAVPAYVGLILLQFLCFWVIHKAIFARSAYR